MTAPRLLARTVEVEPGDDRPDRADLLGWLPQGVDPRSVLCWLREGEGLLGWGRAAVCPARGPARFAEAERWWQAVVARADVRDEVRLPGTGLVGFGSFAFAADSRDGGGLVVPEVLVGRRGGRTWVTTVAEGREPAAPPPAPAPGGGGTEDGPPGTAVSVADGAVAASGWPRVVAAAIRRIEAGEVGKVVLARDVLATSRTPLRVDRLLRRLAGRYRATWTFAVDGLVGATPEMLVRLQHGQVRSRVLAGTVRRDHDPAPSVTETHPDLENPHRQDPRLHLVSSDKDLGEHAYAVRSVAEALQPHCTTLDVPAEPFVLELPDVYHLASDLTGELRDGATSLVLAAALHPSAAVCGTPSEAAGRVITELEGMDRGRYAGPVGWVDAAGDGDWGIALRCGQLLADRHRMRLFAGGGIVAASDPDAELTETTMKLAAMRHALGVAGPAAS
ncbi:isochorismate synthase [Ornithinicoccus halotolerans]|uniref:isochorismate synthase n=1 Tax=Ornithinicoccus halotolerans TaxID=1748220 RepID=UPI001E43F486|nr:isochorismate synthase [Ornithinicoccus halotolerans]